MLTLHISVLGAENASNFVVDVCTFFATTAWTPEVWMGKGSLILNILCKEFVSSVSVVSGLQLGLKMKSQIDFMCKIYR